MNQPTRVLLVDDQAATLQGMKAVLALCPEIEVVGEANNGQQALESVAELVPQVVLMDIQMASLDGLDTTRQIKARWPGIKVIVLTSYATTRAEALAAGADHFVVKGEAFETLRHAIVR